MKPEIAQHIPVFKKPAFRSFDGSPSALVEVVKLDEETPKQKSQEEQLQQEFEKGLKAGRQAAETAAQEREAERDEAHEADLLALRAELEAEIAEKLGQDLQCAFEELEERLAENLSRLLLPFLEGAVAEHVVRAFATTLQELWAETRGLEITGPRNLLDRLEHELGSLSDRVKLVEGASADLKVRLGDTVIESQFAKWMAVISEDREAAS